MDRRDVLKAVAFGLAGVKLAGRKHLSPAPWHNSGRAATSVAPFVETPDGTRLFVKEWGAGEPVVFVHSWAVNSDLWQYQMLFLTSRGMRCIAFDQRGHGRSSDPGRG